MKSGLEKSRLELRTVIKSRDKDDSRKWKIPVASEGSRQGIDYNVQMHIQTTLNDC